MGPGSGIVEKVGNELPWDRPKPDPDDLDLFADVGDVGPAIDRKIDLARRMQAAEDNRLTLARIAARPILEDPPPVQG